MAVLRRVGSGRIPAGRRVFVLDRDGGRCLNCGRMPPEVKIHVDHLVPVAAGGTDEVDNLATLCEPCNLGKGIRTDLTFAAMAAHREAAETRRAHEARQRALAEVARQTTLARERAEAAEREKVRLQELTAAKAEAEAQRRERFAHDEAVRAVAAARAAAALAERTSIINRMAPALMAIFSTYWQADRLWLSDLLVELSPQEIEGTLRWVEGLRDVTDPRGRWNIARKALRTRLARRRGTA